jgi:putative salt-induced outer membrane protein
MKSRTSFATLTVFLFAAAPGLAQTPDGLMKPKPATTGSTDVSTTGFEQASALGDERDEKELSLSFGGLVSSGNSRTRAATGAGAVRIRRDDDQYSAAVAGNYGRSAAPRDAPMATTAENLQARLRYDRFVSEDWSLFAALSGRRDRFQGLDLRLSFDPGVAYHILRDEPHRLWAELGYDLQYDIRRDEYVREAEAAGEPLEKTQTRHSVRAFAGYEATLSEATRARTGLEYIQAVVDPEHYRLNLELALTSSISDRFALATAFSLRYDHRPLPGVDELDTLTSVSIVFQML